MRGRLIALLGSALFGIAATVPVAAAPGPLSRLAPTCDPETATAPVVCSATVPSWDGVPLDVDVTLPPGKVVPRPLIVMLHGYGGDKTEWESTTAASSNPDKNQYNNTWFASRGYAVLTYTARGFHGSCGQGPLTPGQGAACATGWTHLSDRRFEIRDTQFLAGLLADLGAADPQRIGVTGGSYGGGQSLLLAVQGDKVAAVPDQHNPATYDQASMVEWKSPNRDLPMHLAVAVPEYPWSDLVNSLLPNGRASDGVTLLDGDRTSPVGIEKQTYVSYLFFRGNVPNGYYCPTPCADASADLNGWLTRVNLGEPYDPAHDPLLASAVSQLKVWKSAYYQDALIARTTDRVPVFDVQGWTDQLFPQVEGVSLVNKLRAQNWPVKVAVADVGHPAAQNLPAVWAPLKTQENAFLDAYLKGAAAPTLDASGQVTKCDGTTGRIFTNSDWGILARYRENFGSSQPGATTFAAGDEPAGTLADPIVVAAAHNGNGACIVATAPTSGAASWDFPVTRNFTLLGEPALHLGAVIAGTDAEIDSRLWDVAPNGTRTLVTRGAYRFSGVPGVATVDTPLQGNGWDFVVGHTIRLELTQNDAPYLRIDNLPSAIAYTAIQLTLPTPTAPPPPPPPPSTTTETGPNVTQLAATGGAAAPSFRTASH